MNRMQDFSNIRGIVFDMDGVLLDSESICDYAWEIAAREQNLDDISTGMEKCRGTTKKRTIEILENLYGKYNKLDIPRFMERTHELFYEIEKRDGIKCMPYAKEALEFLNNRYILALASSTRAEPVYRQLTNAGLIHYFKTITTGDMVSHSKPDPEIYITACKSIGLKVDECIGIEDSPNGIKSAFDAGLSIVMIPDKIAPSDITDKMTVATLKSLKDFCDILTN